MKLFRILLSAALLLVTGAFASAQEQKSPEQQEKEMYAMIEKEVEKYTNILDLDMAQEFYIDSILTHDYFAMRAEMQEKSQARVANSDVYVAIQDKWTEKIYQAFYRVLDEEQWAKYLKNGAAREKKARDKREAKRSSK
ncbi:MAG: hypothetical protein IKO04_03110 [Bacteroidales bacterium]|nr:hypothetical protein [Bacteroidales bacterium]